MKLQSYCRFLLQPGVLKPKRLLNSNATQALSTVYDGHMLGLLFFAPLVLIVVFAHGVLAVDLYSRLRITARERKYLPLLLIGLSIFAGWCWYEKTFGYYCLAVFGSYFLLAPAIRFLHLVKDWGRDKVVTGDLRYWYAAGLILLSFVGLYTPLILFFGGL